MWGAIMININEYIDQGFNSIQNNIFDFFINCLKGVANFIITTSDITCPVICLLALAFYVGGSKKAGKVVSASFIFYFLSCALRRFVQ